MQQFLVVRLQLLIQHISELFYSKGEFHTVERKIRQSRNKIIILVFEEHIQILIVYENQTIFLMFKYQDFLNVQKV